MVIGTVVYACCSGLRIGGGGRHGVLARQEGSVPPVRILPDFEWCEKIISRYGLFVEQFFFIITSIENPKWLTFLQILATAVFANTRSNVHAVSLNWKEILCTCSPYALKPAIQRTIYYIMSNTIQHSTVQHSTVQCTLAQKRPGSTRPVQFTRISRYRTDLIFIVSSYSENSQIITMSEHPAVAGKNLNCTI